MFLTRGPKTLSAALDATLRCMTLLCLNIIRHVTTYIYTIQMWAYVWWWKFKPAHAAPYAKPKIGFDSQASHNRFCINMIAFHIGSKRLRINVKRHSGLRSLLKTETEKWNSILYIYGTKLYLLIKLLSYSLQCVQDKTFKCLR